VQNHWQGRGKHKDVTVSKSKICAHYFFSISFIMKSEGKQNPIMTYLFLILRIGLHGFALSSD